MLKFFDKPQMQNGRVIVGERRQWKSLDGDNLYILECVPIYWVDMNTPIRTLPTQTPPKPRRRKLTDMFNKISMENVPVFDINKQI